MKAGREAFVGFALIVSGITAWATQLFVASRFQDEISAYKTAVSESENKRRDAERDRDKFQNLYLLDENTLPLLRQAAAAKYPQIPTEEAIKLMISEVTSPIQENLNHISAQLGKQSEQIQRIPTNFGSTPQSTKDKLIKLLNSIDPKVTEMARTQTFVVEGVVEFRKFQEIRDILSEVGATKYGVLLSYSSFTGMSDGIEPISGSVKIKVQINSELMK